MSKPLLEANICELDGTYFPVKLHAVPRVGELINLFSFIEQAAGYQPAKYYQVVHVVHKMYDAAGDASDKGHKTGWHFVEVFVKPSRSKFFKLGSSQSGPAIRN